MVDKRTVEEPIHPGTRSGALARLVAATGLTNTADGVALLVWAWLASMLTRDPLLVALPPIALRLPWLLFSLPAGVVTDRVNRLRLILGMDALRALGFAAAAFAVWMASPSPEAPPVGTAAPGLFAALLACALLVGAAEVFATPPRKRSCPPSSRALI